MLAHLQPKEEVLILGWGVSMPLPIRSRRYNDQFWQELLGEGGTLEKKSRDQLSAEMGF